MTRVLAALVVMATGTAAAQPGGSPPLPTTIEYEVTSYRTTTLIVDGASLAMVVGAFALAGAGAETGPVIGLFVAGSLGLLLATPVVHAVHGRPLRSVGSFFMRLGMATGGSLLGGVIASGNSRQDLDTGLWLGGIVGVAAASGIDAVYLTTERSSRASLTPAITLVPGGGAQLVLGTTF